MAPETIKPPMTGDEMIALSKRHTLFERSAQAKVLIHRCVRSRGTHQRHHRSARQQANLQRASGQVSTLSLSLRFGPKPILLRSSSGQQSTSVGIKPAFTSTAWNAPWSAWWTSPTSPHVTRVRADGIASSAIAVIASIIDRKEMTSWSFAFSMSGRTPLRRCPRASPSVPGRS